MPAPDVTWELRWHPFRGQWVLFTSHRDARPWIGETAPARSEPPVPQDNALAPGGTRLRGSNPDYEGVYVFTNDLPVFSADAPEPGPGDDLYRTRRATGTAEVVCYHHDPTRSLADLTDDEVTAIVTTWRARTHALQQQDGVAHVLIFENRGAAVGTSNPHPHCQIYAGSMVYATMEREAEVAAAHARRTGRSLLADVVSREVDGPRVISEGDHFFACVPWFAQYAYEVLILPRRPATSLVDLDDEQCRSLALVLRDVVAALRRVVGLPPALRAGRAPGPGRRPSALSVPPGAPPAAAGSRAAQVPGGTRGGRRLDDERVGPRRQGEGAPCRRRLRRPAGCCARSATTCATSWAVPAASPWRR